MAFLQEGKRKMPREQKDVNVFSGEVAPHEKDWDAQCEDIIVGHIEVVQGNEADLQKQTAAARRIQGLCKMWYQRSRFLRHKTLLEGDLAVLILSRQTRCAVLLQRTMRGLLHRMRYKKVLAEEAVKRAADEAKKKKKGKGKATTETEAAPLSLQDVALQHNENFLAGMRAFFAKKWDEAEKYFEAQGKQKSEAVVTNMIELVKLKRDGPVAVTASNPKDGKQAPAPKKAGKK